ncbi:MAG: cytochrome b [Proteobacteria bacterium]|nr:cytochrome b [Pseudomonadota bacterium]
MKKELVYDLPTRVFHWLFSGLFITAFLIAKTVDSESLVYTYHMLVGLTLGFLVLLRLIWGVLGTKHAKLSDFSLNPRDLISYFIGILRGEKRKWAGHNPASSWAALFMMACAVTSALTGYLMTSGTAKENFEDIHELSANAFMIVALVHVAGIVVHTLRYRELIGLSMVNGKKADVSPGEEIRNQRGGVALLLMGLVIAFGIQLVRNYDFQSRTLKFVGTVLTLGENEAHDD